MGQQLANNLDFELLFYDTTEGLHYPLLFLPVIIITWLITIIFLPINESKQTLTFKDNITFAIIFPLLNDTTIYFLSVGFPRIILVYFVVSTIPLLIAWRVIILFVPQKIWNQSYVNTHSLNQFKAMYLFPMLAFALGLLLFVSIRLFGITTKFDGMYYMNQALKMHYIHEFMPSPLWSPLHPFFINLGMFFESFPADAVGLMAGIYNILYFIVFALILQIFNTNIRFNMLFLILLFTTPVISAMFHSSFSEPLFSLFLILTLYYLVKHHQSHNIHHYRFALFFAMCAVLTRYIGYLLLFAVSMHTLYFLFYKEKSTLSKKHYFFWNSLMYLPILLYEGRNYIIFGTFHGYRVPTQLTIMDNAYLSFHYIKTDISTYLWILFVIAIIQYIILLKQGDSISIKKFLFPLTFILFFLVSYIIALICTTSIVIIDPIDTRYFTPIYSYFLLFIFLNFTYLLNTQNIKKHYITEIVIYSLLIITIVTNIHQLKTSLIANHPSRRHFNETKFDTSVTIEEFNTYFEDTFNRHDKILVSATTWDGLLTRDFWGRSLFSENKSSSIPIMKT